MISNQPFAVFDIDGTLIRWQLYHAVAEALAKLGHIDEETHQQIRAARMRWKQRAEEEAFKQYEKVLVEAYDKLVTSLSIDMLMKAATNVFEEYKDQTYTYTRDLIKDLKAQGYVLFAISGSQKEIVKMIADYYGFDDFVGSTYIVKDGRFTGEKVVAAVSKHEILNDLIARHQVKITGSIAVGDSASDTTMLEMVEQPIAFNPDKHLYEKAKNEGWKIIIERKNVVYELMKANENYQLLK